MVGDVAQALTVRVFFGNLFFLQTILPPCSAPMELLWSLANEFWYYLLFPLGLIASGAPGDFVPAVCAALFALTAWFIGAAMVRAIPIWLAGSLCSNFLPPLFSPRTARYLRMRLVIALRPCLLRLRPAALDCRQTIAITSSR